MDLAPLLRVVRTDVKMGVKSTPQKLRYAVGAFQRVDDLEETVRDFVSAGGDLANIALFGARTAIEQQARPLPLSTGGFLGDLLKRLVVVGPVDGAGTHLISPSPLSELLRRVADPESLFIQWIPERQANFLQEQIDNGSLLLWIQVRDGEEAKQACNVLLSNSVGRVQVNDLALD